MAKRIAWLLTALFLFAALVELAARSFVGNMAIRELFDFHPGDGRCVGLVRNAHLVYTGWRLKIPPVEHEVNTLGFRGRVVPRERSKSTTRIVLIGDSFTYGQGVGVDETIAAQLEAILRTESGTDTEVLNFGIPGLNVEEVVEQFDRFASQWRPDIVLYLVFGNDLDRGICRGVGELLVAEGWRARLVYASHFIRISYMLWAEATRSEEPSPNTSELVDRFIKETRRLASLAARGDSRLGLVFLGWPLGRRTEEMLRGLSQIQVPALDVSDILSSPQNHIPNDGHLTPEASRVVAEEIAIWLRKREGVAAFFTP
ncbi:MAG: SGNH/GDSL hydrolase family protein [Phycisphaerales bacterium]